MYTLVKDLPETIQTALESINFHKKDINIEIKEKVCVQSMGGNGYRNFSVIVDIVSGECKTLKGSWGGANPWNNNNRIDLDDQQYTIPENICVILGREGGSCPVMASITMSPKNIVPGLLPEKSSLTKEEINILEIFKGIKASYRKEYLIGKNELVNKLVDGGYLKKNANGATQITTLGKNQIK